MTSPAPVSGIPARDISPCSLLTRQARQRPDAIAVTHAVGSLTFRQLDAAAARLGSYLIGIGVEPDTCVGVYAEPSADLMTAVWGILSAGAAYLPLSPDYPADRLRYMIEDSGTTVVVTQPHLLGRARGLVPAGTTVVTPSDAPPYSAGGTRAEPRGEHLAYVIYTSGSTGRPKGVMIEQRSVVSQLRWLANCGYLGPEVSILQKTPMSFDAAQWEILAPAVGARVVMGTPGMYRDPEAIIAAIREYRVTALQAVPTLLRALVETERLPSCDCLGWIFSGGEALTCRLARDLLTALPRVSLVNLYGPTETTINATSRWLDPGTLGDGGDGDGPAGTVPVGVPADNVTCYILDEDMKPVGIGESGELLIGGAQVARGYVGLPEQTASRFIVSPFNPTERLYRTGDLCQWNPDGTIQFLGRADSQVKLRGYRVELDEVASRIEEHVWVRHAAAVVTDDPRTASKTLVAVVELNERTAAVMDQGRSGAAHHRSKASKLQTRAQLSNLGLREPRELEGRPVIELPGRTATPRQRSAAFARKTYRFYDGGPVTADDILAALRPDPDPAHPDPAPPVPSRPLAGVALAELGEILRWFGPFRSAERLLPKYAYASPGALYATQLYVETSGLPALGPGVYYYHPFSHRLVRVGDASPGPAAPRLRIHFLGRTRAIQAVYQDNAVEVLEFEAGHMAGVLEEVLPGYGLAIEPAGFDPRARERLDPAEEDRYLGSFAIVENRAGTGPSAGTGTGLSAGVELFVQAHGARVKGLDPGLYRYREGRLDRVGDGVVEKRHVIAINQGVYDRSSFGISAVARGGEDWLRYIRLGATLHRLQRRPGLGFMSSGYSSKTGNPLPASRRLDALLDAAGLPAPAASYFFLGGRVSDEQAAHEGMNEDAVHAKGPAEMIRDDLARFLPDYMIPARVLVVDKLPLTANGKIDARAAARMPEVTLAPAPAAYVAPATPTQRWLAAEWGRALRYDSVSARDDFFASGGNSLHAMVLINKVNREFGVSLPLQVIFESPRLDDLARRIDDRPAGDGAPRRVSRLVLLYAPGDGNPGDGSPLFCWPGLGGYPMNLRPLGQGIDIGRPFYGVQARGINPGETPHGTIRDMATADIAEIRRLQPSGPYTLWGYSFGARVAFEAAWQFEQSGDKVDQLLLICPGNPKVPARDGEQRDGERRGREAAFGNPAYVTILFSVFAGAIDGPAVAECLDRAVDEDSFVAFVHGRYPALDSGTIRRITRIVARTYEFEYAFRELREREIDAPITIFKARGDDYSFIEGAAGYSAQPPAVINLAGDHYDVLKEHRVGELIARIRPLTGH